MHGHGMRGHRREKMMEYMAARGGRFGRGPEGMHEGGFGGGPDGGRGFGGHHGRRGERLLGQGDIRFVVLRLIENGPLHGYEIIKKIEEMSLDSYTPSPGVIYPTLTFLEEAGYAEVESDGNKKSYGITDEGRAYLEENRAVAEAIIARFKVFAERSGRSRGEKRGEGPEVPRSVEAALMNLREVIAKRLEKDGEGTTEIVRKLLSLADDLD